MRLRTVKTIFVKETREALRDRRTLFTMVVLPILLYPTLILGFTQLSAFQQAELREKAKKVGLVGGRFAPGLGEMLDAAKGLEVTGLADAEAARSAVVKGDVAAAVVLGGWPAGVEDGGDGTSAEPGAEFVAHIVYKSSDDESKAAGASVQEVMGKYTQARVDEKLAEWGKSRAELFPIEPRFVNVATAAERTADVSGGVLAFLVLAMALTGAFYPAIDTTAGEKERGTLETLLASPASRLEIVVGKYLTVVGASLVTALLNLASMGITLFLLLRIMTGSAPAGTRHLMEFDVAPASLGLMVLVLVPVAALFAAVGLALASFARSTKEAQYYFSPLYLVVLPLGLAASLPNVALTWKTALVPVAGASLLMEEMMSGTYNVVHILLVVCSTGVVAGAALVWTRRLFDREEMLFREAREFRLRTLFIVPRNLSERLPSAGQAGVVYLAGLVLFFVIGTMYAGATSPRDLLQSHLLIQLGVCLGLPVVASRLSRLDLKKVFRWRPGRAVHYPLVVCAMAGAALVATELHKVTSRYFASGVDTRALEESMRGFWAWGPIIGALLIAFLPGFAEEMFFRGYMLRGLARSRRRRWLAALIVGALFAVFHGDPGGNPARALLGFVLGMAALWSGSIFVAAVGHATNNLLGILPEVADRLAGRAVSEAWIGRHLPWLGPDGGLAPWYWTAGAAALMVGALVVMKLTETRD